MTTSSNGKHVFRTVSQAFVGTLRRASRVAKRDEDGELVPLSQTELAERSGLARSTLQKYASPRQEEEGGANPDLNALCRLADTLNIPPAFLLMRREDWVALATAAETYREAWSHERYQDLVSRVASSRALSPAESADAGLRMGKALGLLGGLASEVSEQVAGLQRGMTAAVAGTCALPPFAEFDKKHSPVLLALCAQLGVTINHQKGNS